jgi:hypothetical protein
MRADSGVARRKKRQNSRGEGARSGFVAAHGWQKRRKGRERSCGQAQSGGRRRHARRGGVAAAWERLPDVEERGTASEGNTGGGRRDRATRGARRRATGARGRPAAGVTRAQRSRGDRGLGEDDGGPGCKSRNHRGLTVKHGQLSHQCSNGDGPKRKNAGFFKSHNFALGFICKRAIVLKLV